MLGPKLGALRPSGVLSSGFEAVSELEGRKSTFGLGLRMIIPLDGGVQA